jgi:hypothetical protein
MAAGNADETKPAAALIQASAMNTRFAKVIVRQGCAVFCAPHA